MATSQGYRSNVIKPMMGLLIIAGIGLMAALHYHNTFVIYFFCSISAITFIAAIVAYFICLCKNPDLLRSEKFILEKTAIEKASIHGDSVNGTLVPPKTDYVLLHSANNQQKGDVS